MDLSASGRGWSEIANTVAGTGRFDISDGRLSGIDLPAVADALTNPDAGPVRGGGGVTEFRDLSASFAVSGPDISTSDLFMAGNEFHLSLSGHGSLTSGATEARAVLTNSTETIPVLVAGTWRQPAIARVAFQNPPAAEGEH
jgi:AsmA protein